MMIMCLKKFVSSFRFQVSGFKFQVLENKTPCLAAKEMKIFFLFCCLRVPQATKKNVVQSGTSSLMDN
jgi:hypothetical protein